MERTVQVFQSFDEAEQAQLETYAAMTPQERLDLVLELGNQWSETYYGSESGFERVCRVIERPRR